MDTIVRVVELIIPSLGETMYMVLFSTVFAVLFGLPLGIILVITGDKHIFPIKPVNIILGYIVNMMRSLPFIILIIAIFPLSRLIVGTAIGSTAAIVPLAVAAIPFVARIVETALKEVPWGTIEAAQAMGADRWSIVFRVLLPESLPGLVLGFTLTVINLLGYSAMAGAIGGGGLGDLAVRYGYQRFQTDVLIGTVIVLIIIVQVIQTTGNQLAKHLDKR